MEKLENQLEFDFMKEDVKSPAKKRLSCVKEIAKGLAMIPIVPLAIVGYSIVAVGYVGYEIYMTVAEEGVGEYF